MEANADRQLFRLDFTAGDEAFTSADKVSHTFGSCALVSRARSPREAHAAVFAPTTVCGLYASSVVYRADVTVSLSPHLTLQTLHTPTVLISQDKQTVSVVGDVSASFTDAVKDLFFKESTNINKQKENILQQ